MTDAVELPELDSLAAFLAADAKPGESIQLFAVADLKPNRYQPRKHGRGLSEESLQELAESITRLGVLQNLVIRRVDGVMEILAGERRWRASQLAGLAEVPCIVRDVDDKTARAIAYSENKRREDTETVDDVAYVAAMARDYGNKEAVSLTGEKAAYVSKCVKIMSIPAIVDFMESGYSRDVDGFYELAKLYEKNTEAALEVIDAWDADPLNRVGLRVQITRKREAIEQAEAEEAAAKAARENAMGGGGLSDPLDAEMRAEEREAEAIEGALGDGEQCGHPGGHYGDDDRDEDAPRANREADKGRKERKENQRAVLPPPLLESAILDQENRMLSLFTDEGEFRFDLTAESLESLRNALNG